MSGAVCALAAGCAPPAATGSHARLFAADLSGRAKNCTVPTVTPTDGQATPVAMQVGNDGGWCGISLRHGSSPYATGLLTQRPTHGSVVIHPVGDDTRIDYTPARGYNGADAFTVKLIPGDPTLNVSVTVAPS